MGRRGGVGGQGLAGATHLNNMQLIKQRAAKEWRQRGEAAGWGEGGNKWKIGHLDRHSMHMQA